MPRWINDIIISFVAPYSDLFLAINSACRALSLHLITLNDTSTYTYSVGLLWTSDRPDAETSTREHTTLTRDRHQCCRRYSNPQSQTHALDRAATGIGHDNFRLLFSQSIHRHVCDDVIKNGRQLNEKQSCCERRASCSVARWWSVVTMIWGPSLDGLRPVYVFQNPSNSQHPGVTKRVDQHMRASSLSNSVSWSQAVEPLLEIHFKSLKAALLINCTYKLIFCSPKTRCVSVSKRLSCVRKEIALYSEKQHTWIYSVEECGVLGTVHSAVLRHTIQNVPFIVSLNVAALSHRKSASSGISRDVCRVLQNNGDILYQSLCG
jgi:hypothetical protein